MRGKILIQDLVMRSHVGVTDHERSKPQRLLATIEIEADMTAAIAGDDLSGTIDYDALSQRLLAFGRAGTWRLIEKLAADIAEVVIKEFGADHVRVKIKKFVVPAARHIAIEITRTT